MRAAPYKFHGRRASIHGSLAFTGVGPSNDRIIVLGLAGFPLETYDHKRAQTAYSAIVDTEIISPPGLTGLTFNPKLIWFSILAPACPARQMVRCIGPRTDKETRR